ncbi:MAG TPA: serine hydrolase [Trebonia sp.]|nr:serine hydrolase [Trebonia sp.]
MRATTVAGAVVLALGMGALTMVGGATGMVVSGGAFVALAAAGPGICAVPAGNGAYAALAARLSSDILAAVAGRTDRYAVAVYDRVTGITCQLHAAAPFDSASVVKATILAALLRSHQETGQPLSSGERELATLMITESDNDAATDLWNEVGPDEIQDFLDLAGMTQTRLGTDGYWGLTQITAHDELTLLRLLSAANPVLSDYSRGYELGLMARVDPSQSWGVPAGVTTHVKNGWLPDATGWHINSIGAFTGDGRDYLIVVLTDGNPSMGYGVATVEAVARAVHEDLSAAQPSAAPKLAVTVSPGPSPYAIVPALPPYLQ